MGAVTRPRVIRIPRNEAFEPARLSGSESDSSTRRRGALEPGLARRSAHRPRVISPLGGVVMFLPCTRLSEEGPIQFMPSWGEWCLEFADPHDPTKDINNHKQGPRFFPRAK